VTELNEAAAEANSPARPSQPAASSIGADPAPANIRIELISGGNTKKLIPHLFHPLVVERRAVQADP
jgi:hypothetical protein